MSLAIRAGSLLAMIGLFACSPFGSPPPSAFREVQGVPFFAQEQKDDCGPAALASLLAHGGVRVTPPEIRAAVYHAELGGSLLPDLENFARSRGLKSRSGRGDLELLRRFVDAGRPAILLVETGFGPVKRPHYLVVFGYGPEGFLTHNGVASRQFIGSADLDARWEARNRLYLVLE